MGLLGTHHDWGDHQAVVHKIVLHLLAVTTPRTVGHTKSTLSHQQEHVSVRQPLSHSSSLACSMSASSKFSGNFVPSQARAIPPTSTCVYQPLRVHAQTATLYTARSLCHVQFYCTRSKLGLYSQDPKDVDGAASSGSSAVIPDRQNVLSSKLRQPTSHRREDRCRPDRVARSETTGGSFCINQKDFGTTKGSLIELLLRSLDHCLFNVTKIVLLNCTSQVTSIECQLTTKIETRHQKLVASS